MKRIRMCSVILALVLAMTVIFAFPQQAEAANVKINVVAQINANKGGLNDIYKYKYNSKGLVTQAIFMGENGGVYKQVDYKYNSNNLVKSASVNYFGTKYTVKYSYNKNKQLTKRVAKTSCGTITEKFHYKNGVLSKYVETVDGNFGFLSNDASITETYKFNSKGALSSMKRTQGNKVASTAKYKYDGNGLLNTYFYTNKMYTSSIDIKRKLTYKNGVLTQFKDTLSEVYTGGSGTYKYTYKVTSKTLSVPKSCSAIIQKQQQEIINGSYGTELYLGFTLYSDNWC